MSKVSDFSLKLKENATGRSLFYRSSEYRDTKINVVPNVAMYKYRNSKRKSQNSPVHLCTSLIKIILDTRCFWVDDGSNWIAIWKYKRISLNCHLSGNIRYISRNGSSNIRLQQKSMGIETYLDPFTHLENTSQKTRTLSP